MCLIKQRAKNPEQKALRRQNILDATRARFEKLSYEEVNLNHVAADIGITKAALYRYFRNKETLFLALFVESLKELVKSSEFALKNDLAENSVSGEFSKTAKPPLNKVTLPSLAYLVTQSLVNNPIYCKLSAILHTILERNLTLEEAHEFKQELLTLMVEYSQLLIKHPDFKLYSNGQNSERTADENQNATAFLLQIQQALIGVWHMSHPTGAIAQVIETAPLHIFKQNFEKSLYAHIKRITHA